MTMHWCERFGFLELSLYSLVVGLVESTKEFNSVGADGAYTDCPCQQGISSPALNNGQLVPNTYGSHCATWEAHMPGCNQSTPEAWCSMKWCYVGTGCNRTNFDSIVFGSSSSLRFSYTTCGELDVWVQNLERTIAKQSSTMLKVWCPYRGKVSPNPGVEWLNTKASLQFAYDVLNDMGYNPDTRVEYLNLSVAAKEHHPDSDYTACVYDVALGNLDLCLGDFWSTPDRMVMGGQFVSVYAERIELVVHRTHDTTRMGFWRDIIKPLEPFSWDLWGMIVAMLAIAGAIMANLEYKHQDMFQKKTWSALFHSQYAVFAGFFSGGAFPILPLSASGRIMSVGFAFFVTVAIASFTASMTSVLIANQPRHDIKDLASAFDNGLKVCLDGVLFPIVQKTPKASGHSVPVALNTALSHMRSGKCEGALSATSDIFLQYSRGEYCDYHVVGSPVYEYFTGYFSSVDLALPLSYAVGRKRADGTWAPISLVMEPGNKCRHEVGMERMEPKHFIGTFLIFASLVFLAFVVRCCEKAEKETAIVVERSQSMRHLEEAMGKGRGSVQRLEDAEDTKNTEAESAPMATDGVSSQQFSSLHRDVLAVQNEMSEMKRVLTNISSANIELVAI